MSSIKAKDLRGVATEELESQLFDLKQTLLKLRVKKESVKAGEIKRTRKSIARTLTVLNQSAREALREEYKGKKHLPKKLRTRSTRAMRRRLTAEEANAQTLKSRKKASAFPQRNYALKA